MRFQRLHRMLREIRKRTDRISDKRTFYRAQERLESFEIQLERERSDLPLADYGVIVEAAAEIKRTFEATRVEMGW